MAQMVKSLPAMRDTWVQYLGPADSLEKEMATSCLGNPMDRGACQTIVHGVANSQMQMSNFTFTISLLRGLVLFLNLSTISLTATIAY